MTTPRRPLRLRRVLLSKTLYTALAVALVAGYVWLVLFAARVIDWPMGPFPSGGE